MERYGRLDILAGNALARAYADACAELLQVAGATADDIVSIGAHGQTVRHQPGLHDGTGYTLQAAGGGRIAALVVVEVAGPILVFRQHFLDVAQPLLGARGELAVGELDEKLAKLDAFGRTTLFASLPVGEQGRLNRQHSLMEQYSAVLGERIEAFTA